MALKKKKSKPNNPALKLTLEEAGFVGWPLHCLVVLLGVRTLRDLVQHSWKDILESTSGFTDTWPKGWHYAEIVRKLREYDLKLKDSPPFKPKLNRKTAGLHPVMDLGLSVGIVRKLLDTEIETVGDLIRLTAVQLLDIPYVGVSTVYKIIRVLELQGLQLVG